MNFVLKLLAIFWFALFALASGEQQTFVAVDDDEVDDDDAESALETERLGLDIVERLNDRFLDEIRSYEALAGAFIAAQAAILGFEIDKLREYSILAWVFLVVAGFLSVVVLWRRGKAVPKPENFATLVQTQTAQGVRASLFAAFLVAAKSNEKLARDKRGLMFASIFATGVAIALAVWSHGPFQTSATTNPESRFAIRAPAEPATSPQAGLRNEFAEGALFDTIVSGATIAPAVRCSWPDSPRARRGPARLARLLPADVPGYTGKP